MRREREQELVRILSYFMSRGRTEEHDERAMELLYELIHEIECDVAEEIMS